MKVRERFLGDHQTNISLLSDKLEKIRGKDMVDYSNKFESCYLAYRDGGGTLPEVELIAKFFRKMPATTEAMTVQQQLEWEESRRLSAAIKQYNRDLEDQSDEEGLIDPTTHILVTLQTIINEFRKQGRKYRVKMKEEEKVSEKKATREESQAPKRWEGLPASGV